ncbi:peptidoglycan-binding protein [Kibdelosporangium philippinense]|uniref:Peptidoglycan-binding protein n=1 Tax=Kibdelosporangium philippinense TaxID=211113 RepID=A0ABS8Z234_9PSEU|nr:peptidoglycan-binding protein [Kibdelosporangium philippinense]MCE7001417.1 peptidoglycan-binding protein [Kibdelosporangium philippinense]
MRLWLAAVVLVSGCASPSLPAQKALPTVPVTRGDLVSSVQQPGQLGYLGSVQLVAQRQGTVTAMPTVGQVISLGQQVYAVDQRPIPLLYGSLPFYRTLNRAVEGEDVRQLERNLVDLGHASFTPDLSYTTSTVHAVKRWQKSLGLMETGMVSPGDAVVGSGPVRVVATNGLVGAMARPGDAVVTGTGTSHGVHVDLDRRHRSMAAVDQTVHVRLFGGRTVAGVVKTIAAVASSVDDRETIGVDILITSPSAELGGVFEGPVTVVFPGESRRGVLTVPVEALTVMPGGAYAVVVVGPSGRQTVEVTPGLFTSSRVEITGAGVVEGTRVEVPSI